LLQEYPSKLWGLPVWRRRCSSDWFCALHSLVSLIVLPPLLLLLPRLPFLLVMLLL
jgi:hypothetical protein